jgi:uncharacterized protein YdeI (YjbR/CyaY-like superfamily)
MKNTDKRFDEYIGKSAAFAQPILKHIRNLVEIACPEVEETIKWSFPNFVYKGSILCNMAAFKNHCSFGFWLSSKMKDPDKILEVTDREAMGNLGQLKTLRDVPPDAVMIGYIQHAMQLIDDGVKPAKKPAAERSTTVDIPGDLLEALKKNKNAVSHFEKFPPSHRREYIQWITEAKTEPTRVKRINTAVEWISEGKGRNWKYEASKK